MQNMQNQPVTEVEEEEGSIIEIEEDEVGVNLNQEMFKLSINGTEFVKNSRDNLSFST